MLHLTWNTYLRKIPKLSLLWRVQVLIRLLRSLALSIMLGFLLILSMRTMVSTKM